MKAIVFQAPNKIVTKEVPKPKIGKDDVLVRMKAVAICNSTDMHFLKGEIEGITYPLLPGKPGHECAGEIAEAGSNVKDLRTGDRVVPGPVYALPCNHCYYCMQGKEELCENPGFADYAYAEYLQIPAEYCYKMPENLSYEEAALIDLLACTLHGAKRANFSYGETAVIIGQGPAGLLLTQLAKLSGVSKAVAVDINDSRLRFAKRLGADFTVNSSKENLAKKVLEVTDKKGAEIAVDAVGRPATISQAVDVLRPAGRAIVFGFHLKPVQINMARVFDKELEIKASFRTVGKLDYHTSMSLVANRKIDVKSLITHRMPLEQLRHALELIEKELEGVVKVILKP
jgi:L-iditol 2-dehydrogenase